MPKTHLSNREIFKKIREWQRAGHVHPLTCRKDSSHPILEPGLRRDDKKTFLAYRVVLVCPECGNVQERIPESVLEGVPPLPAMMAKPKNEATVTIYRSAWQALLRGERVAVLRVFSEDEVLHHQFGDNLEEFIVRVKITPVTD